MVIRYHQKSDDWRGAWGRLSALSESHHNLCVTPTRLSALSDQSEQLDALLDVEVSLPTLKSYLTECIHQMDLESKPPHRIVNLLLT